MYDPLHDSIPGINLDYPNSYWADVSGESSDNDGQLQSDLDVDVAIIGGGFTGLSCAYHLAAERGIKAVVLEANQTAWGCSGRNAGFVLKSSGRKSFTEMANDWGNEVMRGIYQEMAAGVDTVNSLIAQGIDCDRQAPGYLKVAHKPNKLKELIALADVQRQQFGYQVEVLSKQQVREQYMDDQQAYGAIRYQDGFGLNPLKLAWGYQRLARQAGAKIYTGTPVVSWHQQGEYQELITPSAKVRAKKVVLATNGYTPKGFHPWVNNRFLPVLSQIIVTEPLTEQQIAACNWQTNNVVMDTRALKYYYRKLPDNRILFGGRGAITGKGAEDDYYPKRLLSVLKQSFPALKRINYDYAWAGWICMSFDDIPHIYHDDQQQVFYAMGYCGAGLSFSAQAGKRLAESVAEKQLPNLPIFNRHLPKFPFAPLRRVGQWGYFQYGKIKDRYF
ncbi:NAD(P)/FAD-dependent oxidoreductase [Thalassotalea euphylliae]|uniref:FAD-binding oxidoreductase n=1 Tax=Thalassotalea euphylliae TaxID=1655234 RepID=A0A3E0U1M1_9GAMM|nr:FAD-binding oxidoreductase [Thalassotalea euphylliae]REL30497.1 FAD-binding oxidoreductase [Thalassotalea euphylliae]